MIVALYTDGATFLTRGVVPISEYDTAAAGSVISDPPDELVGAGGKKFVRTRRTPDYDETGACGERDMHKRSRNYDKFP